MTSSQPDRLRDRVEESLGAPARMMERAAVVEHMPGEPGEVVWSGEVAVFESEDGRRCYAWEHETDDGGRRVVTVLHVPPVDSPAAAVRAAIVAEHRQRLGE